MTLGPKIKVKMMVKSCISDKIVLLFTTVGPILDNLMVKNASRMLLVKNRGHIGTRDLSRIMSIIETGVGRIDTMRVFGSRYLKI